MKLKPPLQYGQHQYPQIKKLFPTISLEELFIYTENRQKGFDKVESPWRERGGFKGGGREPF
ncbi:hypothetical protein WCP94_002632 [Bilophila wadsworthia]